MNNGHFWDIFKSGWPILVILSGCSIVTWTILVDRWIAIRYAKSDARAFMEHIMNLLKGESRDIVLDKCKRSRKPVARIAARVLESGGNYDKLERAMRYAIQEVVHELQVRVSVLATIGSMSPFIGLLGTVIGIIKAFRDISANAGGGPEVVSAGISEALVTTAAGLLVAIPAIAAYNFCIHQIQTFSEQLDMSSQPLIESLAERDSRA